MEGLEAEVKPASLSITSFRRPVPSDVLLDGCHAPMPRWLAEPELRSIVVSYTTAAPNHGGEGALYIQLRARR